VTEGRVQSGPVSASLEQRVLSVAPQPVFVVDHEGRVVFANNAAARGFGYDHPEDMIGLPSHQTWHHRRPDGTPIPTDECRLLAATRAGVAAHGPHEWFVRADGSMFPTTWWCAPFEVDGDIGAVFAFTDLTERHAAEEARRARDAAEIRAAESLAAQRRILEAATSARRQIARDLHDGAQQRMLNVLLALQLTREHVPSELEALDSMLMDAMAEARHAITELRDLAAGIHPTILNTRGLVPALRSLSARTAVPTSVTAHDYGGAAAEIESCAYFVVAEALTNVVKHACATVVEVDVDGDADTLQITVRDDGCGGATPGRGLGLVGMADRVTAMGGELSITSPPRRGTTICVRLPRRSAPVRPSSSLPAS